MSRFRGEAEDDAQRGREKAAADQRQYDAQGEVEYRRNRSSWYREDAPRPHASGHWRFEQLLNTRGELTGWRVELDGKIVGMLVLHDNDIGVISTSADEDALAPSPRDIMAAFIKLYPDPRARALPAGGRRQLPEGSPFGPSRDWSEE